MKLFNALSIVLPVMLSACGHAVLRSYTPNGGVVRYSGYNSPESAAKGIAAVIPCSPYSVVSDDLIDAGTRTQYMPMQSTNYNSGTIISPYSGNIYSYNGQQTQTNYVPYSVPVQYRELTYTCNSDSRNPASDAPSPRAEQCFARWNKEQISLSNKGYTELSFLNDCGKGRETP